MLKVLGFASIVATGVAATAVPAFALQTTVTQIDKGSNGTLTYHFSVKTDPGETLSPGDAKTPGDFVTIYNFFGFVDGSAKSPAGWAFSSENFGRTPTMNGYPMVLPVDVPNTPNLTWAVTKPVAAGATVDGFTATTNVKTVIGGQYSAQVTRPLPAVPGGIVDAATMAATSPKQAVIGSLPTPSFLADTKS